MGIQIDRMFRYFQLIPNWFWTVSMLFPIGVYIIEQYGSHFLNIFTIIYLGRWYIKLALISDDEIGDVEI